MARRCSVVGCENEYLTAGLCAMHKARLDRHGNPEYVSTPLENFMRKVEKKPSGCWIWTGGTGKGYGRFRYEGKTITSPRAAYLLFKGKPEGFERLNVCHSCDVPLCVNPDHLFVGTTQENVDDKMKKNRHKTAKGAEQPMAKLDDEKVLFIRECDLSGPELAAKFGVSRSLITSIRRGTKWPHVGGKRTGALLHVSGESHPQAKITSDDVREIRASSLSVRELSEKFGVKVMTIYDIKHRRTWKHVV